MSYQALARKWRPKSFNEVVGQGHVVKALVNALDQERIHHAYLFTGTRGVGKTTLARIFAKCLNCEQSVSSTPCGQCGACQEIDEGRFIDLIEVDAASRTKVEDTRELLDNVQYSPTRGNFKVYLIDEVHMLSGHSFNALLKTLEEPPPHVKFLLATTDPQKLPITVLSRCLQFNLKRLSDDSISVQLEKLVTAEEISFEKPALHALARAADGSMRDSLSLLDQAIAYSDGNVTDDAVHEMLGTVPREYLHRIMYALANANAAEIMQATQELAQLSADFNALFEDIIETLHQVALSQAVPNILDSLEFDAALIKSLSESIPPENIQLFYQIALIGKRDLYLSTSPQSALEMTLLRMLAFRPADSTNIKASTYPIPDAAKEKTVKKTQEISHDRKVKAINKDRLGELATNDEAWLSIIDSLKLQGVSYSLASNCSVESVEDNIITFRLSQQHEGIATKGAQQKLEKALQEYFGIDLKLKFSVSDDELETPARKKDRVREKIQIQTEKNAEEDEAVKALKSQFGAEIIEGSVKPLNEVD